MKRRFLGLTVVCIIALAVVVYFAQGIYAQSGHFTLVVWYSPAVVEVESDGTVCGSAEAKVKVEINGDPVEGEAEFNAHFCVKPTGTASGHIMLAVGELLITDDLVIAGTAKFGPTGDVERITLHLADGGQIDATPTSREGSSGGSRINDRFWVFYGAL